MLMIFIKDFKICNFKIREKEPLNKNYKKYY